MLIRAHGEPPSTYLTALKNNIELIDASCPVVLKLQNRVRNSYDEAEEDHGQIVIYGEEGHAEVNGLVGQTGGKAIIVSKEEDLDKIDFRLPVHFFSQTTKSTAGFEKMKRLLEDRIMQVNGLLTENNFEAKDTLCRQVSNREPHMQRFSKEHDVIIFVSGKKSSNGKALYNVCKANNENSYFISSADELQPEWFSNAKSVGVCGATSTPIWLMESIAESIKSVSNTDKIIA